MLVDLWEKTRLLHEQELLALERASETRYGQLADAMPQIVWRANVDGNATYFNERWFEYTGMSPAQAAASPWGAVVHPDDRDELLAGLGAGDPFERELRFRTTDDTYRWHLVRTAAIKDEAGRLESWVGTATDIDDRKRAEEQWTYLLDLVATVSHELRTPLAAIYGSALTLRREDVHLEDEMRSMLLRVIAEEAARLGEIVNDLLLAGQLDSGSLRVQIEPCDPVEIVRSELEAAQAHAPETVALALDAPESLPAVSADPSQLRQVIANLIDNAIKYSPAGGAVTVSLKTDNGNVRLAVSDNGIGIPPDERRRIFEKFYRLDPEMTGGIGGTGLGLYICGELVRRIDGRIWVEENGGHGSTFVVEIPRVATPVMAESLG